MIAIEAAGAMTPVGTNLTDTLVGLYTGVQLFEDLGVLDEEDEALSGMKIPFPDGLRGPERLSAIAHAVVDEATLTVEPRAKIPLLLCLPEASTFDEALPEWPTDLLSNVIAKAAVPLDPTRSRAITRGRSGLVAALDAALAILKDPSVPYALVGGVDSFVDRIRSRDDLLLGTDLEDSTADGSTEDV